MVYENQEQYYYSLSQAEKEASATIFIEFMLNMILQTIESFNNKSLSIIENEKLTDLTKTEKEILSSLLNYFVNHEFIDVESAVTLLKKSKVNIRKYFNKYMKLGILIPIGNNKGRKYKINETIMNNKSE